MPHVYLEVNMAEVVIQIKNLKYRHVLSRKIPFFRRRAVYGSGVIDCSFQLQKGHIMGVVGANGAGKTTLLRLLAGVLRPQAGTISLHDDSIDAARLRARVGHMPEQVRWTGQRTVFDLFTEFCILNDGDGSRALSMIKLVGLEAQSNEPLSRLSQGMRQRLTLGISLIGSPDILLLDEPFNGLDPIASASFQQLLRNLRDKGVSIIISSHLVHDLRDLVDTIAIMHRGQLIEEGLFDEVSKKLGFADLYLVSGTGKIDLSALTSRVDIVEQHEEEDHWIYIIKHANEQLLRELIQQNIHIESWKKYQPSLVDLLSAATGRSVDELTLDVSPQLMVPLRQGVLEDE